MAVHDFPTLGLQNLRALERYPDRTAFVSPEGSLSYAAALNLLGRFQAVLLGLNLPPKSRIAFLSANRADAWLAGVAAQLCGFPTTWLHPLGSLEDQLFQIDDSESLVLIIDNDKFRDRGIELADKSATVKTVFELGSSGERRLMDAAEAAGSFTARCQASLDDPCTLFYSGGTTGVPKGVLRLHRQHAYFGVASLVNFEFPALPRYLAIGPISHVSGAKILPTLMLGGTIFMASGFDPEEILRTIERERINLTLLVPTMIYTLLDNLALSRTDTSSLELLLYGASPMSPTRLQEGIERLGRIFSQLYGQSECYPVTVLRREDHDPDNPERLLSCGHPAIGCDVRIMDEHDQEVRVGEAGEICVRAPQIMREYWRRPELTAETLQNGWLHTGDMARADEEGYLYIVDRKKDLIVSGGFNIYPREIEDILGAHPTVAMAAVVGAPHDKWGEAVTALIVLRPNMSVEKEALVQLVKQRKGSVCAPKEVRFVDHLPVTSIGKIDKKAIKAELWAGQGRLVG